MAHLLTVITMGIEALITEILIQESHSGRAV